jgi:type I restriction enzyme, S subunit
LKDSGIEWLGELPATWTASPLMRLVDSARPIMYGIVLPGPDFPGGVPIVKGGDVSPERLDHERLNRTDPEIEGRYVRSGLAGGDIVYAIRGSIGAAAVVPDALEGANLTQDTARVAPRTGVDVGWLMYALQSSPVFAQLEAGAVGATIRGINIFSLKRALLPVPPKEEQVVIRQHLDVQMHRLDELVASVREMTERFREYRSALITAAVTGQIDVRTFRRDPDEVLQAG